MQPINIEKLYRENGYCIINDFLSPDAINDLIHSLTQEGVFKFNFQTYDDHNLFKSNETVRKLALSGKLMPVAKDLIGPDAEPFYAIVLDKTSESNWEIDWHQDLKVAVKEQLETEAYLNWTIESGIPHVVPPAHVLSKVLYLRIHLDDCDGSNGAVCVLPGTHQLGIVEKEKIQELVQEHAVVECPVPRGGAMLMAPLLLHNSPYSFSSKSRRILQIEYRATGLDGGLSWYS